MAVDLGDHRAMRAEQARELLGDPAHEGIVLHRIPRHLLHGGVAAGRLRVGRKIIAGAERAARARQHDDVHVRVGIGAPDRVFEFARQLGIDRVERLGTVERDAGDAPVALV